MAGRHLQAAAAALTLSLCAVGAAPGLVPVAYAQASVAQLVKNAIATATGPIALRDAIASLIISNPGLAGAIAEAVIAEVPTPRPREQTIPAMKKTSRLQSTRRQVRIRRADFE